MTMKKSTLFVTFGAAALLNVACASTKAEEKPAEAAPAADAAAAPAADAAAAPADGAKAPEGSCGGEKKPEG
jgi:biopolymer transport protein ExbB